jgi:hypothetical protein
LTDGIFGFFKKILTWKIKKFINLEKNEKNGGGDGENNSVSNESNEKEDRQNSSGEKSDKGRGHSSGAECSGGEGR